MVGGGVAYSAGERLAYRDGTRRHRILYGLKVPHHSHLRHYNVEMCPIFSRQAASSREDPHQTAALAKTCDDLGKRPQFYLPLLSINIAPFLDIAICR